MQHSIAEMPQAWQGKFIRTRAEHFVAENLENVRTEE
jgi:hypothetical protein